jgi:phthiodiolone/phenolphthiodiolone dimycocerosates ketoreductase
MAGLRVGVMNNTINSRFGPKPPVQAGADSFWVADLEKAVMPKCR